MVALLWVLLFTIILLTSIKIDFNRDFIEKDFTENLKGILMWFIVVHHLLMIIGQPRELFFMARVGYLATGIFFFISGYGNWISINKSSGIKWLTKRLGRLYKAFFAFFALYLIIDALYKMVQHKALKVDCLELFKDLVTFSLPNNINWFPKVFIVTILVLYLLKKLIKNNKICLCVMTSMIVAYIVIAAIFIGTDLYWYNTILCFALGCFIGEYKEDVKRLVKMSNEKVRLICGMTGAVFILLVVSYVADHFYDSFVVRILHALVACVVVIVLSSVITIGNRFLRFSGENSFEIYLCHLVLWKVFEPLKNNIVIYSIVVCGGTALIMVVYNCVKKVLDEKIRNNIIS